MLFRKNEPEEVVEATPNTHFNQTNFNADITSNDLVSILYGPKATFKYRLIVADDAPFESLLYRERNFRLKVNLIDDKGKVVPNSNKIPISLALYTV